MTGRNMITTIFLVLLMSYISLGYSPSSSCTRRTLITRIVPNTALLASTIAQPRPAISAASPSSTTAASSSSDIETMLSVATTLQTLLDNWEKATVDCTYADVPRELLESKNKDQLLEKASTFALFDKSTSVVSCKRTNKIVRDYLGVTGKGPLANIEKKMLKRQVIDMVLPDRLDDYFSEVEYFSQSLSKASSLSYTAGVADFDSVNNFAKEEESSRLGNDSSNLEQTRKAIMEMKVSIDRLNSMIET